MRRLKKTMQDERIQNSNFMDICNKIDLHTHTTASGHAFSTVNELILQASSKKMKILGISEHGPDMNGAPHESFFNMGNDIHDESDIVRVLFGCEANIVNNMGEIDISVETINMLDYVLAGLHEFTSYCNNEKINNTNAIVAAIEKSKIFAVSHPINDKFPVEIKPIIEAAANFNIALEINNRTIKRANEKIKREYLFLIDLCYENGVYLLLSSDSHTLSTLGNFNDMAFMAHKLGECSDIILNYNTSELMRRLFKEV